MGSRNERILQRDVTRRASADQGLTLGQINFLEQEAETEAHQTKPLREGESAQVTTG
jgi:hypothetical protein